MSVRPGKTISQYDFAEILGTACPLSLIPGIVFSGVTVTGV
jgi:hypothetical protein